MSQGPAIVLATMVLLVAVAIVGATLGFAYWLIDRELYVTAAVVVLVIMFVVIAGSLWLSSDDTRTSCVITRTDRATVVECGR